MRLRNHRKFGPVYTQLRSFSARTSAFPNYGPESIVARTGILDPQRKSATVRQRPISARPTAPSRASDRSRVRRLRPMASGLSLAIDAGQPSPLLQQRSHQSLAPFHIGIAQLASILALITSDTDGPPPHVYSGRSPRGRHSRASFSASAIWAGVMRSATKFRSWMAAL